MLDKIKKRFTDLFCKAQTEVYYAKNSEQGDTNFISILIILGIVIVVAGVFVIWKDQILNAANNAIKDFKNLF